MSEPKRYHLYAGLECQAFTKAEAVLKFSEEDDGIWVKWEDYARLKAEVEGHKHTAYSIGMLQDKLTQKCQDYVAAQRQNEANVQRVRDLNAQVELLKGQVNYWKIEAECDHGRWLRCLEDLEKLRASSFVTAVPVEHYERVIKAGDELERVLTSKMSSYEVGNASFQWRAAKEGKQP